MNKKKCLNIEDYIEIISTYITSSSIMKLKELYEAFNLKKYSKSTIIEDKNLKDSFCILICGTIRHYTMNNNKVRETEQTLRFTLSGNILYQYNGNSPKHTEYLCCMSECIILSISNSILKELGEDVPLKIYSQSILLENLMFEVDLLRMPPEKRYEELCKQYQNIFLSVPLKHIASFLGISPQALCRIRKRLLNSQYH